MNRSRILSLAAATSLVAAACDSDRVTHPPAIALRSTNASALATSCPAGSTRWLSAVNGSWLDATKWSAGVPTATVPACIDLPGTYVVTMNSFAGAAAGGLFHGVPGASTQPVLRIVNGTLTVSGDVTVHGRAEINSPIGGSGTLRASGTLAVAPTAVLTTGDNGTKTYAATTIENEGTIVVGPMATSVSRLTLQAATIVNRGTMSAQTGLGLFLVGPAGFDPAVTLEGGSVIATGFIQQTKGTMHVRGGTLTGVIDLIAAAELRLEHDGGGRFNLFRLGGLVPATTTRLIGTVGANQHVWIGNNHITVDADVVNHGQITVHSETILGVTITTLRPLPGTTLRNASGGTITLSGNGTPTLFGAIDNDGLIVNTHAAALKPNPLNNRGVLRVPQALNIASAAGEPPPIIINEGALEVTSQFNQTGGRFEHRDGTVNAAGIVRFTNLRFTGHGAWGRALGPAGTSVVAPGSPIGRLDITGDYAPPSTTTTEIELAGDEPGTGHDQITVSGTARFAGPLTVKLANGFVPRPCQAFTVLTYAARTGTFSNAATPIVVGDVQLRQVYTANALVLVAYEGTGFQFSPPTVEVSMDGVTDTYDVCSAVAQVVNVVPDPDVVVDKSTLTFAAGQLPQTVTVSASPTAKNENPVIRHFTATGTALGVVQVDISGLRPADVDPPVTTAIATPVPNEAGWNTTPVIVELSAIDQGSGVMDITWSLSGAQTGGATIAAPHASVTIDAEGVTTLTYFARDAAGNVEAAKTLTVRIDRSSPTIACSATPNEIWPPNGRMVPVSIRVTASDPFVLESVTSSETGTNDIVGFLTGTPDVDGQLRATRLGGLDGRTYTFVYRSTDAAGHSSTGSCEVRVPHDQRKR